MSEINFTKAALATHVAAMLLDVSRKSGALAQGMWNPDFCAADGSADAITLCDTLQERIDLLRSVTSKCNARPL